MKTKAIREFEKNQRQENRSHIFIILTTYFIPYVVLKLIILFAYMIFLLLKDLKSKKAKSDNLGGDPIYYYSYFPFSKEDFLKAWFIDDLEAIACIIVIPCLYKLVLDYDIVSYKPLLIVYLSYFLFVGIFKPAKIYNIFYNSKKKSSLYKVYLITSAIFIVLGVLYILALIASFNSNQNILVEKIITRQSLIGASGISFAIYILGNIIAFVDWDKSYKEK